MRGNEFLDKLEYIDDALIEAADKKTKTKVISWKKWSAVAACLCLLLVGGILISHFGSTLGNPKHIVQQWSDSLTAEDYFRYNTSSNAGDSSDDTSIKSDAQAPYTEIRYFSDEREVLESENVIPIMENHPLFDCIAHFNEDGSLYSLVFSWHNRDTNESYSTLSITAGYQEVEQINDCITIEIDENGNIVEPAVTVTERDGIQIVAKGNEKQDKTLTFQTEKGWYQIEGSWNDNYDDMIILLDWIWEHPVNFEHFSKEAGDEYTYFNSRAENPSELNQYIPAFEEMGYNVESESLTLKNGTACSFEGYYTNGSRNIWWNVESEPDYYDQQDCIGPLESLTLQNITDALKGEQHITFMWDEYYITLYIDSEGTAHDIWSIIKEIQ